MHILDWEKFNNVKQIQQKWGRNEEPGAPSLTASTVSFILFIYTKQSVYYVQDANYDPWSDF